MSQTVLGIDLGTSLIKVTLIDEQARTLSELERPIATVMPKAGTAEQSVEAMLRDVLAMMAEIAVRHPAAVRRLVAIGASGQTAGAMAVDQAGKALTPWYPSGLDTRFRPQLEQMKAVAGPAIFASNGAWPFLLPRLAWWRETMPATFERMARVPSLAGFVLGSIAEDPLNTMAVDATTMTWAGAADLAGRRWNPALMAAFGLPLNLLPPVVPSMSVVGRLSSTLAAATGLPGGLPLAVGIGDTVASMIGVNVLTPGEVYSVNGSFTNYLVCLDRCLIDAGGERFQPLASPLEDVWYAILYIAGGGFMHRHMAGLLGTGDDLPDYAALDAAAALVPPGALNLTFMPYALGRFCPPQPEASGGLHGFTLAHGRGEIWRAVLEGLSFDLLDLTNGVASHLPGWRPHTLRLTGGGARSALWCQMQADMLGVPAQRFSDGASAAVGAALTAGVAAGLWPDLRTAAARLHLKGEAFNPDHAATAAYAGLAERRRSLMEHLRPSWTYLAARR